MYKAEEKIGKHDTRRGFTLVEVVIASLILGILAVGSLSYQYFATREARHADVQATASRLAKLVLDDWKGTGGKDDYDPVTLLSSSLTIDSSKTGPGPATEGGVSFSLLDHYCIQINNDFYFLTCSYRDAPGTGPRLLNVAAAWRRDFADGPLDNNIQEVRYSGFCGQ